MFLLKVDKNGKQQWIQYYFHSPTAVGNTFNFEGSNLNYAEEIPSGGFIATGNTSIYNEVSQEYEIAAIVLKVKADGYLENQKIIRLGGFSQGVTIKAMGEEGFALLTECSGSGGHINPVVVRLNNQLNMVWNRFIGQKNNALFAADLTVTAQNEIAITGMLYQDQVSETYAYLVKLKANGNIDWYNSMHYREASTTLFPKSLEQDAEGNFYISGDIQYVENYWTGTGTHSTSSEDATFVIKTNKNGLGQWAVENGQNQRVEYSTDLTVYPNGDFVQSGHLGAIMDFKSYIVKGNAQGRSNCDNLEHNLRSINFKYVHNVVGVEVKEVNIIELEKEVERADNYYLRDRCGATIYNAKVAPQSTTPIMAAKKERAGVFPNPNSGNFSIRLKENIPANSINKLIILDAQGKKLVERSLQDRETNLSLEEYGKGIYLVQIAMGNQIENHKVVVQ
jgi:ribosomal protein L19